MRLKFYADSPGRLATQLLGDVSVVAWTALWTWVGWLVWESVHALSRVGTTLESGASGISRNLTEAGQDARSIPVVGDDLAAPLGSAGDAASSIAGAGHDLGAGITTTAAVLGLLVALVPVLPVLLGWLVLRIRYARRAAATARLGATPQGRQVLALRALTHQGPHRLTDLPDPLRAVVEGREPTLGVLAAREAGRWGVRLP